MITSKKDLKYYLEADRLALGKKGKRPRLVGDEIWKWQQTLRKLEYYLNCKKSIIFKPVIALYKLKLYFLSLILGFSIPANVFGPGLGIPHIGTIVVSCYAKVGANCRLHVCVNIGGQAGSGNEAPIIGNNVYIGPGAKIYGKIKIADYIAIGANSVVNKSFEEPGITIAGVPAKKIGNGGSDGILIKATESLKSE